MLMYNYILFLILIYYFSYFSKYVFLIKLIEINILNKYIYI